MYKHTERERERESTISGHYIEDLCECFTYRREECREREKERDTHMLTEGNI
jgi:hypothetical protein